MIRLSCSSDCPPERSEGSRLVAIGTDSREVAAVAPGSRSLASLGMTRLLLSNDVFETIIGDLHAALHSRREVSVAMLGPSMLHQNRHRRNSVGLLECHNVERCGGSVWIGELLVHFGRHDAFRARDLAEFAVEPDLMSALANDIPPRAAHAQVDVTPEPLRCLQPPP